MSARYIVRLDDACPTMDRAKWRAVEEVLDANGVRPIVAVVPDNQDPELMAGDPDPDFWNLVRAWQAKGWTIAMHGHTHLMRPTDAPQLLPFYRRSEFSGLSYAEQSDKIRQARAIFDSQGVRTDAWIAPAHCFDAVTLEALRDNTDIRVVSDGFAIRPFLSRGFAWVPQQLWGFRDRPLGLWTVCCHPNMMDDNGLAGFRRDVERYAGKIVAFGDIKPAQRRRGPLDSLFNAAFWLKRGQFRAALG